MSKKIKTKKDRGIEAIKLLETFDTQTSELYQALTKPKGLRFRLLKWLYPEIIKVANSLRKCYWSNS